MLSREKKQHIRRLCDRREHIQRAENRLDTFQDLILITYGFSMFLLF